MSYLNYWGEDVASLYDRVTDPPPVEMIDFLAALAGERAALEFAVGTGRVALPLRARGVDVHGVELSEEMAARLRGKPGGADVPVTIGDMATVRAAGTFGLVYLIFNTIINVTTQDAQIAVFENAAAHLASGGHFVIELGVPNPPPTPGHNQPHVFALEPDHIGIDEYTDVPNQISHSHHWFDIDGKLATHSGAYRYVWPSELDLMARIAGLRFVERWADWTRAPFTGDSTSHVSVWQKT